MTPLPKTPLQEMMLCADRCGLRIVHARQPNPSDNEVGIIAFAPADMKDEPLYLDQVKSLRKRLKSDRKLPKCMS